MRVTSLRRWGHLADSAQPALPLAACDAAAIIAFVTIGLISHHLGLSIDGYARDALPLGGAWFAAAALFHLYRENRFRALAATWACGIPAGVLVRALVLGRSFDGGEAAFLAVGLVTIGSLVLALRGTAALVGRARRQA